MTTSAKMTSLCALLLLGAAPGDSVDSILEAAWKERGVEPAPVCTDGEFLRRASLDIIGRVPTLEELRAFLRNPDRAKRIDELLASDRFPRFWSEVWAAILNGYSGAFESNRDGLRVWMEKQFRQNRPWDGIVADIIAATGSSGEDSPVNFIVRYPQDPADKVTRTFLGVRIQCARCHDHPFDRWTQEDYQGMARFFAPVQRDTVAAGVVRVRDDVARARDPKPVFLTGAKPVTTQWRSELALYMTRSKPFGRAFANRLWYHFAGRGIVDPPDDFNRKNRPSVPELLEFLAAEARRVGWDAKAIIRMICLSKAYQLSSRGQDEEQAAVFACRTMKPLMPEQAYDSLLSALDITRPRTKRTDFVRAFIGQDLNEDFTNLWEYRETVQQLMTKLTFDLTVPEGAGVDELYLRLLSRKPTERERSLCRGHDPKDIVFAVCNSNEFFFNH